MRFFATASALMAFAASALAQTADFDPIYTPADGEVVPAGSSYKVTWKAPEKYQDGTVSIHLIGGADQNSLVPISDIATGVANSALSYQWSVDSALGAETIYGLVFKWESDPSIFQYSQPFKIQAGKASKKVQTITTATGIKTVTLTSCPPTTTSTSTPVSTTSSVPVVTPPVVHHNTTTSYAKPTTQHQWNTTIVPSTIVVPPVTSEVPVSSSPVPVPTTPVTGAASGLVAGPVALIGGLAIAFLAL